MIRVCAYCRVSTDHTDQINSLISQKTYFENYINKKEEWELAEVYADEGISGTSTKKRNAFNKMIEDAKTGKFNLILTKEVSRFARNTVDTLTYTRMLKALGVGVFFLNDNINTVEPDAELRLTIMASIAQEESRKTSQRVKWGQKIQMQKGVVFGCRTFGYSIKDGKLTINNEQSKYVKLIFDLYLNEKLGSHAICVELEKIGVLSPTGNKTWTNATILKMLKNEKYIGVLKQHKSITTDYLNHSRKINKGEEEYIIIEENHESIIDNDTFYNVQKEIERRRSFTLNNSNYHNRYAFSSKIECGNCNHHYKRRIWNGKGNNPQIVWQCSNSISKGEKCKCKAIHETVLKEAFLKVLNNVGLNKKKISADILKIVCSVVDMDSNKQKREQLMAIALKYESKKNRLIELYTDGFILKSEFDKVNKQYSSELSKLDDDIYKLQDNESSFEKINMIKYAIDRMCMLEYYNEEICKEVIKKIKVNQSGEFIFYLGLNNIAFYVTTDN